MKASSPASSASAISSSSGWKIWKPKQMFCGTYTWRCELTEAYGWTAAPRFIVRDQDAVYGEVFKRRPTDVDAWSHYLRITKLRKRSWRDVIISSTILQPSTRISSGVSNADYNLSSMCQNSRTV